MEMFAFYLEQLLSFSLSCSLKMLFVQAVPF